MKIYTKKGDAGKTELFGGTPVSKSDQRLKTYGVFDELNSVLGLALTETLPPGTKDQILQIQDDLFCLGAELATPPGTKTSCRTILDREIEVLEREIDQMESELKPIKSFILPGGTRPAALFHLARTVCRRGERELATLNETSALRGEVLRYVNRLSDYLFVVARFMNQKAGVSDSLWRANP